MLLIASFLASAAAPESDRQAFEWPGPIAEQRILFAGAHPDDEWGVAPLLAQACIDGGAKCHFIVASEAHSYGCFLTINLKDPDECSRIRREEMTKSAAMFGAAVEFFGWEDLFYSFNQSGRDKMLTDWAAAAGNRQALADRWDKVLKERRPTIVFTLDPRHGSTCHPGHRANATLLLEAIDRLPAEVRPVVWLEQTDQIDSRSAEVEEANKAVGYTAWPGAGPIKWFDANQPMRGGGTAYDFALAVRRMHVSQFPDEASGAQKPNPAVTLRHVPLVKYAAPMTDDFCSELGIKLPTFDIPGNKEKFGLK